MTHIPAGGFSPCPNGHEPTIENDTPICGRCRLIATHFNRATGKIYRWTPIAEHERACARMQDEMDGAYYRQYFGD